MKTLLLTLFIANALFWGLFPHETHCQTVSKLSNMLNMSIECHDLNVHLMMGSI